MVSIEVNLLWNNTFDKTIATKNFNTVTVIIIEPKERQATKLQNKSLPRLKFDNER